MCGEEDQNITTPLPCSVKASSNHDDGLKNEDRQDMVLCLGVQLPPFRIKSRKRISDVAGERARSFQTRSPKATRHICM